ncbi:MAG TPA: excisionase family DNA-binding protein [Solirubrobacteraceae bacterium]|jgi:excisionase family DNA binding protein
MNVALELPPAVIEQIAQRAAELVAERQSTNGTPWLNTDQAADYIAAPTSRIHDLVQLRKLSPHRDGRRLLFKRSDLDAYLHSNA